VNHATAPARVTYVEATNTTSFDCCRLSPSSSLVMHRSGTFEFDNSALLEMHGNKKSSVDLAGRTKYTSMLPSHVYQLNANKTILVIFAAKLQTQNL
jgi:hypothetical protein